MKFALRAVLCVLVVGCGSAKKRTVGHRPENSESESVASPEDARIPADRDISDAASDFDGLDRWCGRSVSEIASEMAANPIRGEELKEKHVKQLQNQLLDKEVRWRFKVEGIGRVGGDKQALTDMGLFLQCQRNHPKDIPTSAGSVHKGHETFVKVLLPRGWRFQLR